MALPDNDIMLHTVRMFEIFAGITRNIVINLMISSTKKGTWMVMRYLSTTMVVLKMRVNLLSWEQRRRKKLFLREY